MFVRKCYGLWWAASTSDATREAGAEAQQRATCATRRPEQSPRPGWVPSLKHRILSGDVSQFRVCCQSGQNYQDLAIKPEHLINEKLAGD